MNEKQFEECSLGDATHVEMNGNIHELDAWEGSFACKDYEEGHCVGIAVDNKDEILSIPISLFTILGIKPLRENKKREPIVFTHTVGGGIAPPNEAYGKTFLCVELVEEKK